MWCITLRVSLKTFNWSWPLIEPLYRPAAVKACWYSAHLAEMTRYHVGVYLSEPRTLPIIYFIFYLFWSIFKDGLTTETISPSVCVLACGFFFVSVVVRYIVHNIFPGGRPAVHKVKHPPVTEFEPVTVLVC